jgi:hypothetical protein
MSSTSIAIQQARAFRGRADTFDISLGSPPAWQSALRTYLDRKPRPRPGTTVAICDSTDSSAVLRRFFDDAGRQRTVERDRKRKWRARRSPDQIDRYRARDREAARRRRAGRRSPPSAG